MKILMRFLIVAGVIIFLSNSEVLAQERLFTAVSSNLDALTGNPTKVNIYKNIQARALGERVTLLKFNKNTLSESEFLLEIEYYFRPLPIDFNSVIE